MSSFDSNESSGNSSNKSVKFILPESRELKTPSGIVLSAMDTLKSSRDGDQNMPPINFPFADFSTLSRQYSPQSQSNYFQAFCSNSKYLPCAQPIPIIKEPQHMENPSHHFTASSPSHLDTSSFSQINFSIPAYKCGENFMYSPFPFINTSMKQNNKFVQFEKSNTKGCAAIEENEIPPSVYWSTGCIYDPTHYYANTATPTTFCAPYCVNCYTNALNMVPYPYNPKFNNSNISVTTERSSFENKHNEHFFNFPSNALKYPLSEEEEDDDTASDDGSIEGDW